MLQGPFRASGGNEKAHEGRKALSAVTGHSENVGRGVRETGPPMRGGGGGHQRSFSLVTNKNTKIKIRFWWTGGGGKEEKRTNFQEQGNLQILTDTLAKLGMSTKDKYQLLSPNMKG